MKKLSVSEKGALIACKNKYIYDYFNNYQNKLQLLYNIKQYLSGMLPDERVKIRSVFKNCMEELINETVSEDNISDIFSALRYIKSSETVYLYTCIEKIEKIQSLIFNEYSSYIGTRSIDMNIFKVELNIQNKDIVKILKTAKRLLYINIFLNLFSKKHKHPYYLCVLIGKFIGKYKHKAKQQKILYALQSTNFIIPENNLYYFSKYIKVDIKEYSEIGAFWYCRDYKSRLKALNILINLYKNKI